jgi:hypothetical protein
MAFRRSGVALLAALLLLAPLVSSAHAHASHADAGCSVCVVTHHAPAIRPRTPVLPARSVVASTVVPAPTDAPRVVARAAHAGRGPPAPADRSVH